ncbi:hypothetical protein L1F30_11850 [Simiduia sp. 21SJ11W-1]|uniref:hypothetical protein n=1 Tax=Simiduia sp. 21SJ11W-1 TaxID=2909669 RepID=UPI0020A0B830|nr:hypothetical protein [Simiduia sp. 21SJ11W-1]UTA46854.1 hypothetical protein L1F30_11850 [Simiduia sp. 21SJ11W-1]
MFLKHRLLPWLLASCVGFVLASISQSQFVLHRLAEVGVALPVGVRVDFTLGDLLGLAPAYLPIIAIGLAIALPIASWLSQRLAAQAGLRTALFTLAGFCTMATILLSMEPIMNITVIAGSRGIAGLLGQCLAGAAAGWLYALTAPPAASSQPA